MNNSNEESPQLPSFSPGETAWPPLDTRSLNAGHQNLADRVKLLLVSCLYVIVLLWAYAAVVSPAFAYDGMTLTWPGTMAMVWLFTLALVPSLLLPYSLSRPSALILWWLYLSTYVPSILVPALSSSMPFERLLPLQIILLLCMGLLCWAGSPRLLDIGQVTLSPGLFWAAFWLAWLGGLELVIMNGRASLLLQNLVSLFKGANEYAIRRAFHTLIEEHGRGLAYVLGELGNALNPFLIAIGLTYRRKFCLIAGILGQVVVFGLTGFKTAIVSILFLALVALFVRRWRRGFGLAVTSAVIVAILVCAIVDRASDRVICSSLLTRRTLLVPGLATGFYFEHYSRVGPVGLGMHFSRDPTALTPPNEIGFFYFRNASTNANANLWAEGFAELGLPGVLAFTILIGLAIWLYDSLAAKRELVMAVLLAAMPAVMISNTSPTTALVSHGGLAAALLLYLAPLHRPVEVFRPGINQEDARSSSVLGAPV